MKIENRYVNSFPCFLLHIQTLSPHGSHQNQRGLHFDRKFLQVLSHCRRKSFSLRSLKILRPENPTWPGWSSKVANDTPAFFIFQRDNHLKLSLSLVRVFFVSSFQMVTSPSARLHHSAPPKGRMGHDMSVMNTGDRQHLKKHCRARGTIFRLSITKGL